MCIEERKVIYKTGKHDFDILKIYSDHLKHARKRFLLIREAAGP